jgi:hypothetical protein
MAHYRLFFIGPDDHIVRAQVVDCATDSDAIAAARVLCKDHSSVEVWEHARKVERVHGDVRTDGQAAWTAPSPPRVSAGLPPASRQARPGVGQEAHLLATDESDDVVGDWLQRLANGNR